MTERTLVLLRHAKAEGSTGGPDEQRPLSTRGHADAAAAGAWLRRNGLRPDLVLCSPAKRTRQTWHGVAVALADGSEAVVRYEQDLYEGGPTELLSHIQRIDPDVGTLLLVGHNPSISLLSALLDPDGQADSDGLRTSGLAVHRAPDWSAFDQRVGRLTARHTARG